MNPTDTAASDAHTDLIIKYHQMKEDAARSQASANEFLHQWKLAETARATAQANYEALARDARQKLQTLEMALHEMHAKYHETIRRHQEDIATWAKFFDDGVLADQRLFRDEMPWGDNVFPVDGIAGLLGEKRQP